MWDGPSASLRELLISDIRWLRELLISDIRWLRELLTDSV